MKTVRKNTIYVLVLLSICFFSCKKGDQDPVFSLHTRKARLTGDWHLSSGSLTLLFKKQGFPDYNETYNFTEDTYTSINRTTGANQQGRFKLNITFNKDGGFSFLQLFGSTNISGNGTWDFLKGVGKYKNKERLSFNASSIGGGSYFIDAFNKSKNYFIYNIVELRNKKLVLETKEELIEVSDVDSVSYYVKSNYVLVQ